MKVLFIGGTGVISSGCAPAAIEAGYDLTLLNRGRSSRPTPKGANVIVTDYADEASMKAAVGSQNFDVVVNWIAFTPDQVERDIAMFSGRVGQYTFISSASAYQKPPRSLPITESTPLDNPYWQYSRNKIACEDILQAAYRQNGFPFTVVRPSHTYDRTMVPIPGRSIWIDRMLKGKEVIVHGDGTSIWVLTHHRDFANGFTGLLGNPQAIGEAVHITSDQLLTWNQIMTMLADASGVEAKIVHVPSDVINRYDPEWGAGLLGDKAHSVIFDNSKIKRLVPGFEAVIPFHQGAREIISWHLENEQRQRDSFDPKLDQLIDQILTDQHF